MEFEDELVKRFYCGHCNEYFEECELDTIDCSHREEYHGHPILVEDYRDCCPQCGVEVYEKFVNLEDIK